jgi:tetratricopeptide (TPR) repeat protein
MSAASAINRNSATRLAAAALLLSLVSSVFLAYHLDQTRTLTPTEEVLYLQSPRAVKYMSLGYTGLAACIYWTRAVQYFGDKNAAKAKNFDLLLPLLNLAVSLDPHLVPAYLFGGIFLAQKPPYGAGMPDAAVDFLERGVKDNPSDWRLYYHLGFIHYMERQDYKAAADAFTRGNQTINSPPWMNGMPALMLQRAGDIQTARILWTRMYEGTDDAAVKKNALIRLVALRVEDDINHLQAFTESYKQRFGAYPATWSQLIAAGFLGGIPADPSRTPYVLKPDGKVVVTDANKFPFITKGFPEGQQPAESITQESEKLLKNK